MAKQERRSRGFWIQLVGEYEGGEGISQREFCRQHRVSYGTFRDWLSKLRKEGAMERSSPCSML